MRWMLFVLLLAPLATAQVAQDRTGDTVVETGGAPAMAPLAAATDLIRLDIDEDNAGFTFWIEVASTAGTGVFTDVDTTFYYVDFSYHDVPYRLGVTLGADMGLWADSARVYDLTSGQVIDRPDMLQDDDRVGATVARALIVDRDGATPGTGEMLEYVRVVSSSVNVSEGVSITDAMPDAGTETYDVVAGIEQRGDARLASPTPMRQSNGGAGTWVYQVNAKNLGDEDTFHVYVEDVPDGWEVHLPFDEVTFSGDETFPVLVVTPFGHAHGESERFQVVMNSTTDPDSVGTVQLGILYPTIPQPAGHHDTLWLHSQSRPEGLDPLVEATDGWNPGTTAYMNAAEEETNDEGIPVPSRDTTIYPGGQQRYDWEIPLNPGLDIGLDFLVAQTGSLDIDVSSLAPLEDVRVSGQLVYISAEERVLADIAETEPTTFAAQDRQSISLEVIPTIDADLLPFEEDANMVLRLYLDTSTQTQWIGPVPNPTLEPGGILQLPLEEYRDPITSFLEVADGLGFDVETIERSANPGRTAVVPVTIRNDGPATQVRFEIAGVLAEWASMSDSVSIKKGGEATVDVTIQVPQDATPGTVTDFVIMASSDDRPFDRTLSRITLTVDDSIDIPDQAAAAAGVDSPAIGPIAVLALLACLRRR